MKIAYLSYLFLVLGVSGYAQDKTVGYEKSMWAVRNSEYPRVTSDHRAIFKIVAPDANSVQLDLGRKYNMKKNIKGEWECITDSLGAGFHYY